MLMRTDHSSDLIVADRGERIYQDMYQDEYESIFAGQCVVIEVLTKRAYVAHSAAGAIIKAKTEDPNGLFHLIKIKECSLDTERETMQPIRQSTHSKPKPKNKYQVAKEVWKSREVSGSKSAPQAVKTSHLPWFNESGEEFNESQPPTSNTP